MLPEINSKERLGLGDLIAITAELYTRNFDIVLLMSIIAIIPSTLLQNKYLLPSHLELNQTQTGQILVDRFTSSISETSIMAVAAFLFASFGYLAIVYSTEKSANKRSSSIMEACMHALQALIPYALATVLATVLISIGFVFLIIPGVIIAIYLLFIGNAIILKNKSILGSLKYSKDVVNKNVWYVLTVFVVLMVLALVVKFLISIVTLMIGPGLLNAFISNALYQVVGYFLTMTFTVMFLNLDHLKCSKKIVEELEVGD